MKNNKGFTLIELLVVMAIMGLVMILIIPSVSKLIDQNRLKEYENYEKLVIEKTKSYMDKNKDDLIDPSVNQCLTVPYTVLAMKSDTITCSGNVEVKYTTNGIFKYKALLNCKNSAGKKISPSVIPNSCQ